MEWLMGNIKLVATGIGLAACFGGAWYLRGQIDASRLQSSLAAQKTALEDKCAADKQLTKETNDALQEYRNAIASKRDAAERLHPSMCVVPASKLAQPAAGGTGKYAGQNGKVAGTSADFRDYAAECETYRSEVILLNRFGAGERKNIR